MIRVEDAKVKVRPYVKAGKPNGWEADVTIKPSGSARATLARLGLAERPRRRRKAFCQSKSAAERWGRGLAVEFVEELNAKIEADANPNQPTQPKEVPTVEEFFPRYFENHCKANRLRNSSLATVERYFRLHLLPAFGKRRLDRIPAEDVQRFKASRKHLAPTTVNDHLVYLRSIQMVAFEWGVIDAPPRRIKPLKVTRTENFKFYDFEEFDRLILAAEQQPSPDALLVVLLGGEAGLRRGEIRGIKWQDIDFKRGTITVARRIWQQEVGPPKGGRPRTLPLLPRLAEALKEHRNLRSPYILTVSKHKRPGDNTVRRWLARAQKAAGVRLSGPHILRHTFCSLAAMRGVPARTIQAWAGHASIRTTDRYMHLSPSASFEAAKLMERPAGWRNVGDADKRVINLH